MLLPTGQNTASTEAGSPTPLLKEYRMSKVNKVTELIVSLTGEEVEKAIVEAAIEELKVSNYKYEFKEIQHSVETKIEYYKSRDNGVTVRFVDLD